MRQEYIFDAFERFWHWMQAALVLFLAATGFEIHGSYTFFGYVHAVRFHSAAAVGLLVLIVFAIFWHFTTGAWRQYVPTFTHLRAYITYYTHGIFHQAPHPTHKTRLSKLNPLQQIVYLGLKVLLIPTVVISGVLYALYRYPFQGEVVALKLDGLRTVALFHTLGAFLLLAFLIAHLYLITTGRTLTSNLKAMLTGFEDIEEDIDQPRSDRP